MGDARGPRDAFRAILGAAGAGCPHADHPAIGSLEMACTMSAGMAAWMRLYRRPRGDHLLPLGA
ncbi:hypothetical protein [Actinomadura sp. 3N407]|uniref:hypothetical protein n=1 Tax=Actinomadura sp. 3N407 TaxID=3457423 RepID=UPI003FCE62BD